MCGCLARKAQRSRIRPTKARARVGLSCAIYDASRRKSMRAGREKRRAANYLGERRSLAFDFFDGGVQLLPDLFGRGHVALVGCIDALLNVFSQLLKEWVRLPLLHRHILPYRPQTVRSRSGARKATVVTAEANLNCRSQSRRRRADHLLPKTRALLRKLRACR